MQAPRDATWRRVFVTDRPRDPHDARRQIVESVLDVPERLRKLGRALRLSSAAADDRGGLHQGLGGPRQRVTVAARLFRGGGRPEIQVGVFGPKTDHGPIIEDFRSGDHGHRSLSVPG
jgi:hypothetical protein